MKNYNMDTNKWQWFRLADLFDKPYKGFAYNAQNLMMCSFDDINALRYVTRTDVNNGCKGYVINEGFEEIENGNAITIGDTTSTIYYQADKFICGDHIVVLRSKDLNKTRGMFLVTLLNGERYRYNYGRAFKKELIYNTQIKLPVDSKGNPDWKWIENYVKETLIPKLPRKAKAIWKKQFNTKPIQTDKLQLNTVKWQWFKIENVFDVVAGKYHYPAEYMLGSTPYLSATAVNNGVGNHIDLAAEFNGGAITTEKVGCTTFYQPIPFCATSDVNILRRKDRKPINKYIGLFLSSVIDFNEGYRWNYGRQCRVNDTKAIKVKLPAIQNDYGEYEPDWQFMEDYIKSLPYSACL